VSPPAVVRFSLNLLTEPLLLAFLVTSSTNYHDYEFERFPHKKLFAKRAPLSNSLVSLKCIFLDNAGFESHSVVDLASRRFRRPSLQSFNPTIDSKVNIEQASKPDEIFKPREFLLVSLETRQRPGEDNVNFKRRIFHPHSTFCHQEGWSETLGT